MDETVFPNATRETLPSCVPFYNNRGSLVLRAPFTAAEDPACPACALSLIRIRFAAATLPKKPGKLFRNRRPRASVTLALNSGNCSASESLAKLGNLRIADAEFISTTLRFSENSYCLVKMGERMRRGTMGDAATFSGTQCHDKSSLKYVPMKNDKSPRKRYGIYKKKKSHTYYENRGVTSEETRAGAISKPQFSGFRYPPTKHCRNARC